MKYSFIMDYEYLHTCYNKNRRSLLVMGTIMLDHKMGGMLDHDLIEENL